MQTFLIILAAIFLLLAILLFIPVRLEAFFENSEGTRAEVILKYGLLKFRIYPKEKKKEKSEESEEDDKKPEKEPFSFEEKKKKLEKYIRIFEKIKGDVAKLLSYMAKRAVVFDKIEVKSEFGFDEAMQTGIFTGLYNGFVYSVLGVIHQNSTLREMEVKLQPVLTENALITVFAVYCT